MPLTHRLDLRQSQQLVMTPQLQQAIKLLQLSNMDLTDYVMGEVEQNPMLEVADGETDFGRRASDGAASEGRAASDAAESGTGDATANGAGEDFDASSALMEADISLQKASMTDASDSALDANLDINVYNNDSPSDMVGDMAGPASGSLTYDGGGAVAGGGSGAAAPGDFSFEERLSSAETLSDHLTQQMLVSLKTAEDRMIASHLIDLVDAGGYLPEAVVEDVADQLGTEAADVEAVLLHLQGMDPVGVCARNLSECLAIQLRERDRFDPCMQALVENLPLLAKRDMAALKKLCHADTEDLLDMVEEIRGLNPKPGDIFGGEEAAPVVPDIFVRRDRAGQWVVELNSETLPRVLVNTAYVAQLSTGVGGKDKQVTSYVSECVANANWLVKALDQRAKTILKVATALVKKQEMFFNHGIRFLKPLTLRDIAEDIDMHESTVSRVTNNKFMATSRGLFELKYFFTSSIASMHGGDALSAESVKYRIKELIDAEDPKKILSDDKLVAMLKAEGMDIARRTVAKYREALRIPSSVQRRREKSTAV